jgi:hypothetical protein
MGHFNAMLWAGFKQSGRETLDYTIPSFACLAAPINYQTNLPVVLYCQYTEIDTGISI